jgi:hypothetical protein
MRCHSKYLISLRYGPVCAINLKEEIVLLPVRRVELVQLSREMLLDMVGEANPYLSGAIDNKMNTRLLKGIVTLNCAGHIDARLRYRSCGGSHLQPLLHRLVAELAKRAAGD